MSDVIEVQAATVKSASYTLVIPIKPEWFEVLIWIDVSASVSPTTLKIDYQVSPDGVNWLDHPGITDESDAHFNFTTASVTKVVELKNNIGTYVRLNLVMVGTSYTTQIWIEGKANRNSGLVR